jgi:hypothetical protein
MRIKLLVVGRSLFSEGEVREATRVPAGQRSTRRVFNVVPPTVAKTQSRVPSRPGPGERAKSKAAPPVVLPLAVPS